MTAYFPHHDRKRLDPGYLNWIAPQDAEQPDFAGRDVLLCYFSSSSVPCLQTLRLLNDLLPSYANQVLVVGIYSPRFERERDVHSVRRALARLSVKFPVAHDPLGELAQEHHVDTLPSLVLLNAGGGFARYEGEPDVRRLRDVLERMRDNSRGAGETGPVRVLKSSAQAAGELAEEGGVLRFPTVIKPLPGAQQRWAVADCGHHQIVLLDDHGVEQARYGCGTAGHRDGDHAQARFHSPHGLVCSADAIFVADTGNHAIRRIDVTEQRVTTLAGTGRRGYGLPREPREALSSALSSPWDLELDGPLVFFTNAGSHQIGIYNCVDGTVGRLAGTGERGSVDGPGGRARLAQPASLALEESGDRLFFSDSDSGLIRSLTLDETGRVATLSRAKGEADEDFSTESKLQYPLGLAWVDGELLVADCYNDRIVRIACNGEEASSSTAVLSEGLPSLCEPMGVYAEDADRLMLVDTNRHRIVHVLIGPRHAYELWPR